MAVKYVSAYHVTLEYGGPEEGGWHYNAGSLLDCIACRTPDAIEAVKARLARDYAEYDDTSVPAYSVLSQGRLRITVSDEAGADYPAVRPSYC